MGQMTQIIGIRGQVLYLQIAEVRLPFSPFKQLLFLLLVWALPAMVEAQAGEIREAVYEVTKPDGGSDLIRLTFPVQGGAVRGKKVWVVKLKSSPDLPSLNQLRLEWVLEGQFTGGDGGSVRGWEIKDGERSPFTAILYADGTGWFGDDEKPKRYPLRFDPFEGASCGCNLNLNVYEEKARKWLVETLLKKTSAELYTRFVSGTENLTSAFFRQLQTYRVSPERYRLGGLLSRAPRKLPPDLIDKLQRNFENSRLGQASPACSMLAKMGSNVVLTLNLLKAAETASAGDYMAASLLAAAEAIKAYSSGASWAILIAQAVKADWDSFAERVHNEYFRKFYVEVYFQGGKKPSRELWQAGKKARLKAFMEDALEYLAADGGKSAQFRQMLIDFAKYKLERTLSREDFDVSEDGSRLRNKKSAYVLASLFQEYEKVYRGDLETETVRKLAMEQARQQLELARDTEKALDAACRKADFSLAWPHGKQCSRFKAIYNEVVTELKAKGLVGP